MKKRLKGFTLIELIVVMAIFMVIMAAAMQFLPVVQRIMAFSDVQHDGSAAVTNITSYLENELSPVEYIDIYDSDKDAKDAAVEFATKYYEGVLAKGSTPTTYTFASGPVHVLKIDNTATGQGRISRYTFNCNFTPSAVTATPAAGTDTSSGLETASALNEAFYDNASYQILVGAFDDAAVKAGGTNSTYEELASNMNAKRTQFTIHGTVTRGTANPKTYNYSSIASLSMVNIIARGGGGVSTYYVLKHDATNPTDSTKNSIVSITDSSLPIRSALSGSVPEARRDGRVDKASRLFYDGTSTDHYTFVYSYGAEITP